MPVLRQARTALADTPGSLFVTKCEALLAEQQYAELLDELVKHFDLLFSKDPDRGTAPCACLCCQPSAQCTAWQDACITLMSAPMPLATSVTLFASVACQLLPAGLRMQGNV